MKVFLYILFILFISPVYSQVWVPPGAHLKPSTSTFTLDAGVNQFNGDYYLYLAPGFNYQMENFLGLSMQFPVNLLVKDVEPFMQNSKMWQIRKFDYDNKKDFQRLLNYFWIGDYGKYEPGKITASFYIGRMFDGRIGHGTIINRYVNNPRLETYKLGVMADVNTDYGGFQVFTNSVADRDVNAGRAYVRPYSLLATMTSFVAGEPTRAEVAMLTGNAIDEAGRKKVFEEDDEEEVPKTRVVEETKDPKTGEVKKTEKEVPEEPKKQKKAEWDTNTSRFDPNSIWNRFAIGMTSAVDGRAPYQFDFDTTGKLKYDKYGDPKLQSTKRLGVVGFDLEFLILNLDWLKITPYADFNRIRRIDNAKGEHYGVNVFIGSRNINFMIKPEFRKMSSSYIPNYFDSFYEIERYQMDLENGFPTTKYDYVSQKEPWDKKVKGYYHTFQINIYKIAFDMSYENYSGKNNSRIFAGVYVPIGSFILLSGYYTKKGFDAFGEAFKPDNRAQGAAEVGITIGPIITRLQNLRSWFWDQANNRYEAKDEKKILFSAGRSF